MSQSMSRWRGRVASAVWLLAVAAAVVLAVGALLANLYADRDTVGVRQVLDAARVLAGPLDGLFRFYGDGAGAAPRPHDVPREDLVNWAIAALAYLVVGRVVDAAIRPRTRPPSTVAEPPLASEPEPS